MVVRAPQSGSLHPRKTNARAAVAQRRTLPPWHPLPGGHSSASADRIHVQSFPVRPRGCSGGMIGCMSPPTDGPGRWFPIRKVRTVPWQLTLIRRCSEAGRRGKGGGRWCWTLLPRDTADPMRLPGSCVWSAIAIAGACPSHCAQPRHSAPVGARSPASAERPRPLRLESAPHHI